MRQWVARAKLETWLQFIQVQLLINLSVCQKSAGLHDWKKFPTVERLKKQTKQNKKRW